MKKKIKTARATLMGLWLDDTGKKQVISRGPAWIVFELMDGRGVAIEGMNIQLAMERSNGRHHIVFTPVGKFRIRPRG